MSTLTVFMMFVAVLALGFAIIRGVEAIGRKWRSHVASRDLRRVFRTFATHGEINTAWREKSSRRPRNHKVCTCRSCELARSIIGIPKPPIGKRTPERYA